MNLGNLIKKTAKHYADRTALIENNFNVTFKELNLIVNKLANGIHADGIKKGDRIAFLLKNSHHYLEFKMAMEKLGVVYVPINYYLSNVEIEYIIADSDAKAIICDKEAFKKITKLGINRKIDYIFLTEKIITIDDRVRFYDDLILSYSSEEPEVSVNVRDLCSINYTSGTTGKPKGVMLTQRNWIEVYKNMLINREINSEDRLLHLGPLTHSSGSYFMPFFLRGAENIIIPNGFNLDSFFYYLEKYKITAFTCVPTVLSRIINDSRINKVDKSSLRMIGYGAAPMPAEQIKKAIDIFGPILVQNYGQTEAYMTISLLTKEDHELALNNNENRLTSVGRPYTFVQVEVMDEDGNLLNEGEIGELVVKADHVMEGYWNLPNETNKTIRDGWLLTGDLAKIDKEGYIYILGRKNEMIISGGFNIYPREVEDVLYKITAIKDASVIGVEDQEWGQKVIAFIVPHDNGKLNIEEINEYCREQLGFKKPKEFIVIDSLPKNSIGKINKRKLEELYNLKKESAHIE